MTIEQLETAMLIQAAAFTLLAAALVALSIVVVRLIATLEGLRRQVAELSGNPLHKAAWPKPGQLWAATAKLHKTGGVLPLPGRVNATSPPGGMRP